MKFNVILATDTNNILGANGKLPWNSIEDLEYFKTTTSFTPFRNNDNILICGRKTWESMKHLTLPNRKLYVVSRNATSFHSKHPNVHFYSSFQEALNTAYNTQVFSIWVIGGKSIYL